MTVHSKLLEMHGDSKLKFTKQLCERAEGNTTIKPVVFLRLGETLNVRSRACLRSFLQFGDKFSQSGDELLHCDGADECLGVAHLLEFSAPPVLVLIKNQNPTDY